MSASGTAADGKMPAPRTGMWAIGVVVASMLAVIAAPMLMSTMSTEAKPLDASQLTPEAAIARGMNGVWKQPPSGAVRQSLGRFNPQEGTPPRLGTQGIQTRPAR